jgi:hypothetical protein
MRVNAAGLPDARIFVEPEITRSLFALDTKCRSKLNSAMYCRRINK